MNTDPCRLWSDAKDRKEPGDGVILLRPLLGIGCSAFSVIGCLYIIVTYRIRQSKKVYVDSVGRLVHVLAWLDFVGCIARILLEALKPTNPSQWLNIADPTQSPDWFDPTWTEACREWKNRTGQILCAVLHFSLMGSIFWHCVMAYNLFRWVCKGDDQRVLHQRFVVYFWCMSFFALVMTIVPYLDHAYDTHSYSMRFDEIEYAVGCHYVWLVLGWFFMIVFLVRVQYDMRQRLGAGLTNHDTVMAYNDVGRKLVLYVCAYLVFRISNVVDWLFNTSELTGDAFFIPVLLLNNVLAPLTGFVNAVIYGGISPHGIYQRCCCSVRELPPADANTSESRKASTSDRSYFPSAHLQQTMGHARLFVSTFDLNRAAFPRASLALWLPSEVQDLYVLGLQNCADVDDAKASVLAFLNAKFAPLIQFQAFSTLSRRALHSTDVPIVQLVFARSADVAFGNVSVDVDRQGKNGSRYITGLSLRYFDAALAFATLSLKPTTEEYNLHRKLQDIAKMLKTFSPDVDNPGLDFPHQYHHTILAGNFNFNLSSPRGASVNQRLAEAFAAEAERRAADAAIDASFGVLPPHVAQDGTKTCEVDGEYEAIYEQRQSDVVFGRVRSPEGPMDCGISSRQSFDSFLQLQLPGIGPPSPHLGSHALIRAAAAATDEATAKWDDLVECDRLRTLMDANEVFCGFEEAKIEFLPPYPRIVGTAASFEAPARVDQLFEGDHAPLYADRILHHSLPGVESRLEALAYYVCEAITISPHKAVCAQFRLEVNRLHTVHAAQTHAKDEGMKEPSNVKHLGFHLSNIDANLWELPKATRGSSMRSSSASTLTRQPSFNGRCARKLDKVPETYYAYPMHHAFGSASQLHSWRQATYCECKYCDASDSDESIAVQSVEPVRISVIFPLPATDNFRFQRKIYELAQSVTQTYDVAGDDAAKAHDDYTSCTECSWADAVENGLMHTSVIRTSAANSLLHVVVKVEGPRGTGGEGVLALCERDVGRLRQFDVALSWGGKLTGFLHVDVEMLDAVDADAVRRVI
ncbi:hypothetical protein ACHHYP_08317 [Achlya hypogyna]|uniref:Inositol polyphosphate-related phosphatase domain-containing protein n=1 Tax=Achlya hypogyna TaxID=1202772 RepID=A0A1V9ZKP2_ACHHY|nr:hypothetical protein ACHHYP_08317 [Achlya hypogyna]